MALNRDLITKFVEVGVIKFGEYMMKKGVLTPVYIDLRTIVSYPALVQELSEKVWEIKINSGIEADVVCGVPYTALPIATSLSVFHDIPLVLKRKELKGYGTKKLVEGVFKKGQRCLIIEDVVSTGSSVSETAACLRSEGLTVTNCIAVVDREEGGQELLLKGGITLHTVFNLKDIISSILKFELISDDAVDKIQTYFREIKIFNTAPRAKLIRLPFSERAEKCTHPILKKLYRIMDEKKTNLCIAVDVVKSAELFQLTEVVGPHICILKTHIDILENFSKHVITSLREMARKYNFLILEDRKFADIGSIVQSQYVGGLYRIQDWADIITVHSIAGEGVIEGLKSSVNNTACILVAEVNSKDSLTDENYVTQTVSIAQEHKDFVIGFISQHRLAEEADFVHFCPGIHTRAKSDPLGLNYKLPEVAILNDDVDIVIVGRGITKAKNINDALKTYKSKAYKAYLKAISSI